MKTLIIGAGEVGKSLYEVLSAQHLTYIKDLEPIVLNDIEVLNICIPYSPSFVQTVTEYQKQYKPKVTIIHATVPPGTSRLLGAVHSPIHGKHPNLAEGIRTFAKYVGGVNKKKVLLAKEFLRQAKIRVKIVSSPEASELSKLCCTSYYGLAISFMKDVKTLCDIHGVDFNEVYGWNRHYNRGYAKLKMKQFLRPVLRQSPGRIGGHCVINNAKLLETPFNKYLLERNDTYGA